MGVLVSLLQPGQPKSFQAFGESTSRWAFSLSFSVYVCVCTSQINKYFKIRVRGQYCGMICVLVALIPVYLSSNSPGKALDNSASVYAPTTHVEDPDSSWSLVPASSLALPWLLWLPEEWNSRRKFSLSLSPFPTPSLHPSHPPTL